MRDLSHIRTDLDIELAFEDNRWCKVSHVREETTFSHHYIAFFATYDDGIKIKRQIPIHCPWIVKKDSIPQEDRHEHHEECGTQFPADMICVDVPPKDDADTVLKKDPWSMSDDELLASLKRTFYIAKTMNVIDLVDFTKKPGSVAKQDLLKIARNCKDMQMVALNLASRLVDVKIPSFDEDAMSLKSLASQYLARRNPQDIKKMDVVSPHPDLSKIDTNAKYGKSDVDPER